MLHSARQNNSKEAGKGALQNGPDRGMLHDNVKFEEKWPE